MIYPQKTFSFCLLPVCCLFTTKVYASPPQKPNIILINIDDLGWADVGFNGSKYYETPNIDKLKQNGINFTNAYASAANSAPSRACLLSGLYTPRHGVYTVHPPERGKAEDRGLIPSNNNTVLGSSVYTLPMAMKAAGYQTCNIGKWHVGEDPTLQGMDVNIGGNHAGHPKSYFSPYGNPNLSDGPEGEYLMDRLSDEAVNYIKNVDRNKPFFLHYATYAVHTPLQAKAELIEKYKQKESTAAHNNPIYAAMVENMDQSVGKVLNAVEQSGLAENTLIIFTSDNGGVYHISKQWALRAGKGSFYEGGIRVPFIVYMKGCYEGGTDLNMPVSQIDLFPTFCELTDTKPPIQPDGKSLLPVLNKSNMTYLDERPLYWHFPAYLEGGHTESRDRIFRTRPVSVIRKGNWKLIENYEDGSLELYNLNNDVSEKTDLSKTNKEMRKQLYGLLNEWKKEVNAPIPQKK